MMGHGRLTRMGRLIFFVLDKTKNDKTLRKNANKKSQKKKFMFGKILLWSFVVRRSIKIGRHFRNNKIFIPLQLDSYE